MRSQIRDAREELRQAGEIAAGKPYVLRMKFLDPKYALLDKLWSAADEYADLAKSAADATKLFEDHEDKKWRNYSGRNLMLQRAPCP